MPGRISAFLVPLLLALVAVAGPRPLAAQEVEGASWREARMLPGDVIRVAVWREPDLSGEFMVNRDGVVTLPLVGDVEVTDRTVAEVIDHLLEAYRYQLRNPSIQITPLRRINVLGEVRSPGLYLVDPTVTLAEAIALAGGPRSPENLKRIRIVRAGEVIQRKVEAGTTLSSIDVRSGDDILLDRGNWLQRSSTYLITTAVSLGGLFLTRAITDAIF